MYEMSETAGVDQWGEYPDERAMMGMGGIGRMAGLVYVPDLAPVGSGPSYYPRSVADDIRALVFLGFMSPDIANTINPTTGTQAGDMAAGAGAWDQAFQSAIHAFQGQMGLVNDGWTGPNTRTALAKAVAMKNAQEVTPPVPPSPIPIPPSPIPIPPSPNVLPGPGPAPGPSPSPVGGITSQPWFKPAAIILGLAAVGGIGYWALSD